MRGIITIGGPIKTLTDWNGKTWRFEDHHYFGPMVVRKDGLPTKTQPGSRSPFWECYKLYKTPTPRRNP